VEKDIAWPTKGSVLDVFSGSLPYSKKQEVCLNCTKLLASFSQFLNLCDIKVDSAAKHLLVKKFLRIQFPQTFLEVFPRRNFEDTNLSCI